MELDPSHLECVRRARAGDAESAVALAAAVDGRVRAYLNRILFDQDKAQELTQDTVAAVMSSLATLREPERFWPWVFRIATNKCRQLFRHQKRHPTVSISAIGDETVSEHFRTEEDGYFQVARQELGELTRAALAALSERHRMALTLRFYEDLPHAEIATVMGCTEITARATFLRAKHALLRELKRRGIRQGSLFAALLAFGELTAPSSSSAVSASAVAETVWTGVLFSKAKIAAVLAACLLFGLFFWDVEPAHTKPPSPPAVRSVHFTEQSMSPNSVNLDFPGTRSKGAYEQWFHFPEGVGGPFLSRMQRWNPKQTEKLCWWVQNEDANYYVFAGDGTIHIQNDRLYSSSLRVKTLPTDSEAFTAFIRKVERESGGGASCGAGCLLAADKKVERESGGATADNPVEIIDRRDANTGFLQVRTDCRFPELGRFQTNYDYSELGTHLFDSPTGPKMLDERDAMHKRGWTYFRVSGKLNGHDVAGIGRIPFTYRASMTHGAWLQLSVGGTLRFLDNGQIALLFDAHGKLVSSHPGGSGFTGLSRPWQGFHTVDSIRRDAATERIWFTTEIIKKDEQVSVTLTQEQDGKRAMGRYTVDLDKDLLTEIQFWTEAGNAFERTTLTFDYLQDVDAVKNEFVEPSADQARREGEMTKLGPMWALKLLSPGMPGAI